MRSKKRKSKVLIVLGYLDLGGAERQAIFLSEYLSALEEFNVQILGFEKNGIVKEILEEKGIQVFTVAFTKSLTKSRILINVIHLYLKILSINTDYIISFTRFPNIYVGSIWRFLKIRKFIWNQRDEGRGLPKRSFVTYSINQTKYFISNSKEGKGFLVKEFEVPKYKVKIVPNGIQLPFISESPGSKQDGIICVMVANYSPFKDHFEAIRVWEQLRTKLKESELPKLHFYGKDFGTKEKIISEIQNRSLENLIHVNGFLSDISKIYLNADILLHCSQNEGVPNAILEAMSYSLPVVSTDFQGAHEALGEEYPYISNDTNQVVSFCIELCNDIGLREAVGMRNRKRIEKVSSIERMGREYVNLLLQDE